MRRWFRGLFGYSSSKSDQGEDTGTYSDPAWLVWLIENLAQVPSRQPNFQFLRNLTPTLSCIICGKPKEPQAREIQSLYCQRCARAKLRHLLEAEFRS
jgi:hypothetical protein